MMLFSLSIYTKDGKYRQFVTIQSSSVNANCFSRLYPVDKKRMNEFGATGEEVAIEDKKDK